MSAPHLFDSSAIDRHLARASHAPATFLMDHVAADLGDRLSAVLRRFEHAIEIGSLTMATHKILSGLGHAPPLRLGRRASAPDVVTNDEALPLAAGSADLIVSLLSLQAVDDVPGVLAQIRRALRPDGVFMAALFGGETLKELREAFAIAESEVEGGVSPRVSPFMDVREAGSLLQRAGFALPVTDMDTVTVRYANAFRLMADLRAMGATNPLAMRRRTFTRRTTLLRMAEIYAARFADADGRLRATFEIVWMSGWAPHESQQKPLKPGSAKTRLADALGTVEIKSQR